MMTFEYLAGLFDGEGHISVNYAGRYPTVKTGITQKNVPLLHLVHALVGLGKVSPQTGAHVWEICKKNDAVIFLTKIAPYLILRKAEAEVAIQLCSIGGVSGKRISEADEEKQVDLITELQLAANRRRGDIVCQ